MTLKYEFGGDDYEQGEEFEYEVDKDEAFVALLEYYTNGRKKAELLANDIAFYMDVDAFLHDNRDIVKDVFADDAEEAYKENTEVRNEQQLF